MFFKRIFCIKRTQEASEQKTSEKFSQEKTEIALSKNSVSSESKPKPNPKHSKKSSKSGVESEINSIFYDKNSALVDSVDKNKALDNLDIAFGIINQSDDEISKSSFDKQSREQFTKVMKGLNFKEILASDESIVMSESN